MTDDISSNNIVSNNNTKIRKVIKIYSIKELAKELKITRVRIDQHLRKKTLLPELIDSSGHKFWFKKTVEKLKLTSGKIGAGRGHKRFIT